MPVETTVIQNFLLYRTTARGLKTVTFLGLATLYCTLSHFFTVFGRLTTCIDCSTVEGKNLVALVYSIRY